MTQIKQNEWKEQWSKFIDNELFLFKDWIYPVTIEDFKGKDVLECGCGGGQHTSFLAPIAREIVAVDLNTIEIAKERNRYFDNIKYIEADVSTMELGRTFDIVFSIGVVQHTDDPDKTVVNLIRHVKKGGRLVIWVYSKEGNFPVEKIIEPLRKAFLTKMKRDHLVRLSQWLTFILYIPIYTIYLLPLRWLPYHEYFSNFRKLSFNRNTLNVFDKLNAPQVQFINKQRAERWMNKEFKDINISPYMGVSWRISGVKSEEEKGYK